MRGAEGTARYGMRTVWVFSRDGMGKGFRLSTTEWEWDGKVGNHLVNGTGLHEISWWDGTGRDRGTGREYSREIGREHNREMVENIGTLNPVGKGWEHDDRELGMETMQRTADKEGNLNASYIQLSIYIYIDQ